MEQANHKFWRDPALRLGLRRGPKLQRRCNRLPKWHRSAAALDQHYPKPGMRVLRAVADLRRQREVTAAEVAVTMYRVGGLTSEGPVGPGH